ncbi:MAG: acyl-CoA/acyl-ACP dehydrogenase [Ardenticatenales bacterium]|nr:acyl-CoA/acyl-ACP dehydrogenase [Ardenticatenales bacterium]
MHVSDTPFLPVARELAREFAARADEADRAGRLPPQDVAALRRSGYLTLSIPREQGGQGLSLADCLAAQLELAQGSPSTALVAGMQMHVFGHEREVRAWREADFANFCRLAVHEGALFNSVASEPALGSPSRGGSFQTHADPTPDGANWIVNGHKTWTTGGRHLTHMLVRLSLQGSNGVMLIPQGLPGIEWRETWSESLSLRASDSHDLLLHDVVVPYGNLIESSHRSRPNVWFPLVMSAIYLGAALAARHTVIQFALERVPTALGKPIATLPKIQRQIGDMDLSLQAARALLFEVAEEWRGRDEDRAAMMPRIAAAKLMVNEMANKATEKALQIAGGTSITRALPLERYFRDVRAGSMQPPSGDTALEMIGRAAIGPLPEM